MAMPVVKTLVARWDVYGINRHAGISRTAREVFRARPAQAMVGEFHLGWGQYFTKAWSNCRCLENEVYT